MVASFGTGAFLFRANLHTDDAGLISGLIFLSAALIAFLFRKPGLILGSMIGWSILASEVWNSRNVSGNQKTPFDFAVLPLVVTLISVLGSVGGYALRKRLSGQANPPEEPQENAPQENAPQEGTILEAEDSHEVNGPRS